MLNIMSTALNFSQKFTLLLVHLFLLSIGPRDERNYYGKHFTVVFTQSAQLGVINNVVLELYFASDGASGVNVNMVKITAPAWPDQNLLNMEIALPPNQYKRVELPAALRLFASSVEKKGIRIEADADIVVFVLNRSPFGKCGGSLVLPDSALGSNYFVKTFKPETLPSTGAKIAQIAIVANQDGTTVSLRFPNPTINAFAIIRYQGFQ